MSSDYNRNAKEELLEHIEDRAVKYVCVYFDEEEHPTRKRVTGTLEDVLPQLDFVYDAGYGAQELFGTVWYEDGTWSIRGEYDGLEWWKHIVRPRLPIDAY